eukprot:4467068-Prymnesium_polylepis.1
MGKKSPKGKGKGFKGSWTPAPTSDEVLYERPKHDQHYIVQVSPVTWPFLGFTARLPASTVVFELQARIMSQHGDSISDVTLYKDEVQPRNVLTDLSVPLSSIDFVPIHAGDALQDPVVHLCYDFPPHEGDCPLLLCPPKNLKIEAQAAVAEAKNKPRLNPGARARRCPLRCPRPVSPRAPPAEPASACLAVARNAHDVLRRTATEP